MRVQLAAAVRGADIRLRSSPSGSHGFTVGATRRRRLINGDLVAIKRVMLQQWGRSRGRQPGSEPAPSGLLLIWLAAGVSG